ncbi:MAG: Flp pilus assembly complex ATPase component TadA [Chloroflexi bacterium]|nr:Flp pilus assembly complex ATPase component TadA [Chloroflexota bacterium]
MFRRNDKTPPQATPPSIPAWDKSSTGPANNTSAPSGTPNVPASPPAFSAPAFSAAARGTPVNPVKEASPYDVVLEAVKDELKTGRQLAPSAYDNPTDDDYAIVMEVARRQIQAYNVSAPTRGLPLLVDGAESEVAAETESTAKRLTEDVLGWGPISPFMEDPMVEEIFINGHDHIYVQRAGKFAEKVSSTFRSEYALRMFINNKLDYGSGGRGVTVRTPWRDHRLRDGSRVHVIMDPLVSNLGYGGIAITIRRFRSVARSLNDMVKLGSVTTQAANFLRAAVKAQLNIAISGGTGTGKTTFMQVLTSEIDLKDRVITVEDTPELALQHLPNWVALVTRERAEGVEAVTMADNVRHCLRMRPKRILLGEARGPEMIAILEAMNTGHDGCMFTVHADDAYRTLQRIETLYLKGGMGNVPLLAIRREIAQALQLIVNIGVFRMPDGREVRRAKEINFVTGGVEGELITHEPIFQWVNERGKEEWTGRLEYTHACPMKVVRRLEERVRDFNWQRDIEEAG